MWSTIANFKENLNQIALEVQDAAEELEIYRSGAGEDTSISDRRVSHRFAQSKSMLNSPTANGTDSTRKTEIDQYKAEINRLQASEAEIKALSVNYAALLKEKEEQLSRLHEENGVLRKNLDVANVTPSASKSGTSNQSPIRQDGLTTRANNRSTGNHMNKIIARQDSLSNGSAHMNQSGGVKHKMETKSMNFQELADLLEDKNRLLATMQADHDLQIKQLKVELNTEREISASIKLKSQEEHKLIETFQKELHMLKMDKEKTAMEINELRNELNEKVLEIKRLQMELTRQANEEDTDETAESLKRVIADLQKENYSLKTEKGELEVALKTSRKTSPDKIFPDDSFLSEKYGSDEANISGKFTGKEEMELSLQKLEKDFKEVCRERDKALQELARLKQHLLDKELEESDKMDEDSKLIEELRANSEYQRSQILYLEKALKQAVTSQEEIRKVNSVELEKSKEMINELNQKLANCMNTIDDKNIELLNLQTALGQYYAESEAKGRLERDLVLTKEAAAKLSGLLKDANLRVELSKKEMEDTLAKLSQAERTISEGRHAVNKLEEDNTKLRRALEQSMTRLNRMSMDSDYFVDRRIVIKLLVTYFQRNHSKEVLDLMVRMLGFSEEDKQRIGLAQQGASKGVVRGVLGLPGRLVGGILGGGSPEDHASVPAENQSFADLWVDFLLKETEERERRESAEASGVSKANPHGNVPSTTGRAGSSMQDDGAIIPSSASSFHGHNPSVNDVTRTVPPRGILHQPEHSDSEFSTVPLTSSVSPSSENSSRISRLLPRY